MAEIEANGIRIAYEVSGPADGEPLLLIHGLGAQLVRWPAGLLGRLGAAGFRSIRFDNRDVGRSTHMVDAAVPDLASVEAARRRGEPPVLPYTLSDMAADAAALLDALGYADAHVLGLSLGGMIAQVLAIEHPHRLRSLAIIMSQTGNPDLPVSRSAAMAALTEPPPDPRVDRDAYLDHVTARMLACGSRDHPTAEAELRAEALAELDRGYDPPGKARQHAAARGTADLREGLRRLAVPTLVIHGADDPLVPLQGGEDILRSLKDAWLLAVNGMGHDLPPHLFELFAANIRLNASRTV